jgi:hypothetical protein
MISRFIGKNKMSIIEEENIYFPVGELFISNDNKQKDKDCFDG